jgi:hypothetical protein
MDLSTVPYAAIAGLGRAVEYWVWCMVSNYSHVLSDSVFSFS